MEANYKNSKERRREVKTRFVVEYNIPVSPVSRQITPILSSLCACFPYFMDVDAVCAKDAVGAVLAACPNALIVAVRAQMPYKEEGGK